MGYTLVCRSPGRLNWKTYGILLLERVEDIPHMFFWLLSLWRRSACQTLSKALDISGATARVAPDLLKDLAILSDTTVSRSDVDWEDLKPSWKSEKRLHFSRWWTILKFTGFSNTSLPTERRKELLAVNVYPTFLNTGTADETFQQMP